MGQCAQQRKGGSGLILDVITLSHTVHDSQERRREETRGKEGFAGVQGSAIYSSAAANKTVSELQKHGSWNKKRQGELRA